MTEQAVLIEFIDYSVRFFHEGDHDLDPLHKLEQDMMAVIEKAGVGEVDGHELAMDGTDGMYFLYGPDARALFAAIEPLLRASKITYDAKVTLRFGESDDPSAREEVIQLSGPEPRPQ